MPVPPPLTAPRSPSRPVPLCAHVNAEGHPCRRIPRRGQPFCPAHQNRRRLRHQLSQAEFEQEIHDYCQSLRSLPLPALLDAVFESLSPVGYVISRRAARLDRVLYAHAMWAVTIAMEHLAHTHPADRTPPPPAPPRPAPPRPAPSRPVPPLDSSDGPSLGADLLRLLDSYR